MNGRSDVATCFVIQPFGKKKLSSGVIVDNDKVYDHLLALETIRPTCPIKVTRADTVNYKDEALHPHVLECIRASHFCIADFTGLNANVLYEAGVARGLGRPTVLICQDRDDIPSDLKHIVTVCYRMDALEYLSSAIVPHLDRVQLAVIELKQREEQLYAQYFPRRDSDYIKGKILGCETKIDILHTNLSTVQAVLLEDILARMRDNPRLQLRILTLDPHSAFVTYRAKQLGFITNVGDFRDELVNSLKNVLFRLRDISDRARVRIYDEFPTQICYSFDQDLFVSVVSITGRSRGNCAFLVNSSLPGVHQSFIEHFDRLWNQRATELQLE